MSTALTFAERIQHSVTGTVIGVVTVFAILMILWFILVIMQFAFSSTNKESKKKAKEVQAVPEPVVSAPVAKTDDTQLIAVITAAIAVMLESQGITTKFRVKSFRRTK